jgi:hypothetical protein
MFRFVFGSFVPSANFVLTRTEIAYRAALLCIAPFLFAWFISWYVPGPRAWPFPVHGNTIELRRNDYKIVSAALYSEAAFNQPQFWHALTRSSRRQVRLIFWYYVLVIFEATLSGCLAVRYGKFKGTRYFGFLRFFYDRFIFLYISQWYVLLTPDLLPNTAVQVDILSVNDIVYQGRLSRYFLKDGELSGIFISDPKRFNREKYLKDKEDGQNPQKENYWVPILSNHLYFFAEKILNINLTYVDLSGTVKDATAVEKFLTQELGGAVTSKLTINVKN